MKSIFSFTVLPMLLFATEVCASNESHWFPIEQLYPVYLADPYETSFHMQLQSYAESTIPDTGSSRWDLMAGAPMIIYQNKNSDNSRHGWQMVFIAALRAQFDNGHNQDSVAWEGIYGLQAVFRYHDNFAWRFGTKHYSSHVGDEYIERTGRDRIQYTREEWRAGIAWTFNEYYTAYSDIAYAFSLRNQDLQDYGRAQIGLQYEKPAVFMDGKVGWYSALDISAFEEDDWDKNITFQVGFDWQARDRRWRLGLEFYDGRSQYGEFFQNQEKYASIGVWLDL